MINVSVPTKSFSSMGYAITIPIERKIFLPVSSSSYVYSHFKHVSGVQVPEGLQGVTINRLKIVDVLIEQLSKQEQKKDLAKGPVSENYLEALIEEYRTELKQQTLGSGTPKPYGAALTPKEVGGSLFDLVS